MIKNKNGSFLIESLLVTHLFFVIVVGLLSLSFYFYCKIVIQNTLHETLVCHIREKQASFCNNESQAQLNGLLFYGQLQKFKIYKGQKYIYGEIKWSFKGLEEKISIKHKYKLLKTLIKPAKRAFL